ncbi:MAG: hypothetical protein H6621_11795 [Halobacteriovoraceae bacterium]|nr:hypothetical protein [Halobacteriovoraceae bacterium]MCB9095743.1 hypothetical protein [Halobacteriovoraceae bacterium]
MKLLVLFLSWFSLQQAFCQYSAPSLGLGLQNVGDYVDVLFKVEAAGKAINIKNGLFWDQDKFFIVRMKAEGAFNSNYISSLSTKISTLEYDVTVEDSANFFMSIGFTVLDFNYERNIDIDQDSSVSLTAMGVRLSSEVYDNRGNKKLFLNAAFSGFGLFLESQRRSDGVRLSPKEVGGRDVFTYDVSGTYFVTDRFQITVGVQGQNFYADGETYYVSHCGWRYDSYYDEDYWDCWDEPETDYDEFHRYSKTYLKLVYQITPSLAVFGEASLRKFSVTDQTGFFENSKNRMPYFGVGVKYQFNHKKKKL